MENLEPKDSKESKHQEMASQPKPRREGGV
jgi:hypothetical protein